MVKSFSIEVLYHFFRYDTTIYDWAALDKDHHVLNISFAPFATANLYYCAFGKLVKGFPTSGKISYFIAITHYKQYGKLMKGFYLVVTFKDYKEDGVNVDRKNGRIDANWNNMEDNKGFVKDSSINMEFVVNEKNSRVDVDENDVEDNEGSVENSAIDMEFVINPDAKIVNSREIDKGIGDTISGLLGVVGKRVDDANKGAGLLYPIFLGRLERLLVIKILEIVYLFFSRRSERVSVIMF